MHNDKYGVDNIKRLAKAFFQDEEEAVQGEPQFKVKEEAEEIFEGHRVGE